MCIRTPVKVKRKPITVLSKNGWNRGGWFPFPKPDEEPPVLKKRMASSERVLWCPYCDEWSIFKRPSSGGKHYCQGVCGWSNTEDFYVKTYNKIWFEDVPLSELKKIDIPRPSKGRR
jgi:hypothetical protein